MDAQLVVAVAVAAAVAGLGAVADARRRVAVSARGAGGVHAVRGADVAGAGAWSRWRCGSGGWPCWRVWRRCCSAWPCVPRAVAGPQPDARRPAAGGDDLEPLARVGRRARPCCGWRASTTSTCSACRSCGRRPSGASSARAWTSSSRSRRSSRRPAPAAAGCSRGCRCSVLDSPDPPGAAQPEAVLTVRGAPPVRIKAVHPRPPVTRAAEPEWRAALAALPGADSRGDVRILAGDFNATLDHSGVPRAARPRLRSTPPTRPAPGWRPDLARPAPPRPLAPADDRPHPRRPPRPRRAGDRRRHPPQRPPRGHRRVAIATWVDRLSVIFQPVVDRSPQAPGPGDSSPGERVLHTRRIPWPLLPGDSVIGGGLFPAGPGQPGRELRSVGPPHGGPTWLTAARRTCSRAPCWGSDDRLAPVCALSGRHSRPGRAHPHSQPPGSTTTDHEGARGDVSAPKRGGLIALTRMNPPRDPPVASETITRHPRSSRASHCPVWSGPPVAGSPAGAGHRCSTTRPGPAMCKCAHPEHGQALQAKRI